MKIKPWVFILIQLIVTAGIAWAIISHYNNEMAIAEHNFNVSQTTMDSLKNENGTLTYWRDSYKVDLDEACERLEISKQELKKKEKELDAKTAYIAAMEGHIQVDTLIMTDTITIEKDKIYAPFSYNNQWMKLDGDIDINKGIATTSINTLHMAVPLRVGLNNKYQIWVESDNPYVKFTSIDGAMVQNSIIDNKRNGKPKFVWGLQLGIGAQYGLIKQNFDVGPYLGFGIGIQF